MPPGIIRPDRVARAVNDRPITGCFFFVGTAILLLTIAWGVLLLVLFY